MLKAFSDLARAALEPKALGVKINDLMALGALLATRCDACIAFHAEAAVRNGAEAPVERQTLADEHRVDRLAHVL